MTLVINDEAFLRNVSEPVTDRREGGAIARRLNAELAKLNKRSEKKYRRSGGKEQCWVGLGLSAPQIGILKRVCVMRINGKPLVLINPEVVEASDARIPFTEGCLSFPGKTVDTERHAWVKVKADNHPNILTLGPTTPEEWTESNLLVSIVAQHEISHLAGLLMDDFARGKQAPAAVDWFKHPTQQAVAA